MNEHVSFLFWIIFFNQERYEPIIIREEGTQEGGQGNDSKRFGFVLSY